MWLHRECKHMHGVAVSERDLKECRLLPYLSFVWNRRDLNEQKWMKRRAHKQSTNTTTWSNHSHHMRRSLFFSCLQNSEIEFVAQRCYWMMLPPNRWLKIGCCSRFFCYYCTCASKFNFIQVKLWHSISHSLDCQFCKCFRRYIHFELIHELVWNSTNYMTNLNLTNEFCILIPFDPKLLLNLWLWADKEELFSCIWLTAALSMQFTIWFIVMALRLALKYAVIVDVPFSHDGF